MPVVGTRPSCARAPVLPGSGGEKALRQMAQGFPTERIERLHGQRIEGPEAALDGARQRAQPEPADSGDKSQGQGRPQARQISKPTCRLRPPGRDEQRRQAKQHARRQHKKDPAQHQLAQVDLAQQAAGQGQKRALLRAAGVILDIAIAGIDELFHGDQDRRCAAPAHASDRCRS